MTNPKKELYLVHSPINRLYKIGVSNMTYCRLGTMQNESPVELELLYVFEFADAEPVEKQLHDLFASQRHHGEWFELTADDVAFIASLWPIAYAREPLSPFEETVKETRFKALRSKSAFTIYRLPGDDADCFRHAVYGSEPKDHSPVATVSWKGAVHMRGPKGGTNVKANQE